MEKTMKQALKWAGKKISYIRVFPDGDPDTVMVEIFLKEAKNGHDAVRVQNVTQEEFDLLFKKVKAK